MMARQIDVPNLGEWTIENIVLDYNGTLAENGEVAPEVQTVLTALCREYKVYVITADTFGTVAEALADVPLEVTILTSEDHTTEKAVFVEALGSDKTVAIGNGNNDRRMLDTAALSIAIMGAEGCATGTLMVSDIVLHSIIDAMELFLYPKRLIATLRK